MYICTFVYIGVCKNQFVGPCWVHNDECDMTLTHSFYVLATQKNILNEEMDGCFYVMLPQRAETWKML